MFKKLAKKLAITATLVCMAGTVVAASACSVETDHPTVRITVEFNGADYNLDYTLYRNMYPNTVRHFIELADADYYDGMLVHDYRSTDWLSGAYAYDETAYAAAAESNSYADYLENNQKEEEYLELFEAGRLTSTVFTNYSIDENDKQTPVLDTTSALPTLIGEFTNNIKQVIEKGALTSEVGVLKMYYYSKETTDKVHVTPTPDQVIWNADYKYNCATSLFAMQVSVGSSISASDYCVFGRMDSTEVLINLMDAVQDYLDTLTAQTISVRNVSVDNLVERFSSKDADKGIEADFTLPAEPILIKSVSVTKY